MARTFIALELPPEVVDEIRMIQKMILKNTNVIGKMTEEENLHLTLKFLGEITQEQTLIVREKLKEIKSYGFFAELGEVGVFSKDFIKIIWVKLNGLGVFNLQKEIDEKLRDLFPIERRFMSHITIYRVKNVKDKKNFLQYLKGIKPKKINFPVKEFFLKKSELFSEGPKYEEIEIYKFEEEKI